MLRLLISDVCAHADQPETNVRFAQMFLPHILCLCAADLGILQTGSVDRNFSPHQRRLGCRSGSIAPPRTLDRNFCLSLAFLLPLATARLGDRPLSFGARKRGKEEKERWKKRERVGRAGVPPPGNGADEPAEPPGSTLSPAARKLLRRRRRGQLRVCARARRGWRGGQYRPAGQQRSSCWLLSLQRRRGVNMEPSDQPTHL